MPCVISAHPPEMDPERSIMNLMTEAYNDTDFNVFDEGITPTECVKEKNRRILLRNIPSKMKPEACRRVLEQFGTVVDINVPKNQECFNNKDGFSCVFAEFKLFSEAEKAVRELNREKCDGLNIRAFFAHTKKLHEESMPIVHANSMAKVDSGWSIESEEEIVLPPPMTVQYDDADNDVYEKVSAFELHNTLSSIALVQMNWCKQLALDSRGSYVTEEKLFVYNRELAEKRLQHQCSNCDNEALFRCRLSSLLFCSINCNVLKTNLSNISDDSLDKKFIRYGEPIKVKDQVIISSIINERCVYVRRSDVEFSRLMNDVLKYSKNAQKLETLPDIDDVVLVRFMDDIYRAQVIELPDDESCRISVRLIDYGNTAQVFLKDLMVISVECQHLECVAHKVTLKDVRIDIFNWDIVDFLVMLSSNKTELLVSQIDSGDVVLTDSLRGTSINEQIVNLSLVEEKNSYDGDGFLLSELLQYVPEVLIPSGTNKKLFVVNSRPLAENPEMICCVSESKMKDFRQLYKSINAYGQKRVVKGSGITYGDKQICLAFSNQQWHRAVVLKTRGDGRPECLLIDLHSIQFVDAQNIIPIPKCFIRPAPVVEDCFCESQTEAVPENSWIKISEIINENFVKLVMN